MRRASTIGVLLAVAIPAVACSRSVVENVNEAISLSSRDPVIAFLVLRDISSQEKLTPDQNVQLDQEMASLQPKALAILQRDFKVAADGQDLRSMVIASRLANSIAKDSVEGEPAISETKSKLLSGAEGSAAAIWRVTRATAKILKGSYTAAMLPNYTPPHVILEPAEGFQFMRVNVRVENISAESDKTYALWAPWIDYTVGPRGRVKTRREGALERTVPTTEPHRWLHPGDIYVVTPSSDLRPVAVAGLRGGLGSPVIAITTDRPLQKYGIVYISLSGTVSVVTPSPDLRPLIAARPGGLPSRVLFPPKAVIKGGSIDMDVVFSVPKGVQDLRILILGAAPVSLNRLPSE